MAYVQKWLVQQHIYLQDYRRRSAAVSQRRNGHMQVCINIINGLMRDRLTRPSLMSL